ncbi:MAG: hypothetical protein AAF721_14400 [Myxococcota bacterium]
MTAPRDERAAATASQHVWKAEAHLSCGRIGKGIEALDAAAQALAAARDDRAYVRVAQRILAMAPNRVDTWRGLAYAQLRWGDVEGAGKAVVAWLKLRPEATDAIECMAEVFGRRGRRELAAKTLARLGAKELDAGRPGAAARLCERARSWSPHEDEVGALSRALADVAVAPGGLFDSMAEELSLMPSRPRARTGQTISTKAVPLRDALERSNDYFGAGGSDPDYALAAVGL